MKSKLVFVFVIFAFFGCNNQNNLMADLQSMNAFSEYAKVYKIIITHDTECQTCLWQYENFVSSGDTLVLGYYYVEYDPRFKNVLTKINKDIKWTRIGNDSLYKALANKEKRHGPFTLITDGFNILGIQ